MEEKKNNKLLYLVIIVILLFVVGGFFIINGLKHENNDPEEESQRKSIYPNIDKIKKVETKISNELAEEVFRLDKFYIGANIENINDRILISFAAKKYVFFNNVDTRYTTADIECFKDENKNAKKCKNIPSNNTIKKSDFDEFVKKAYHTDRVITLDNTESYIGFGEFGDYYYNPKKETYSFGMGARGNIDIYPIEKITKIEIDGDNLYVYQKAFYCKMSAISFTCANYDYLYDLTFNKGKYADTIDVFLDISLKDGDKNHSEFKWSDDLGKYDVAEEEIYKKYQNKVQLYKFTYILGEDKDYHWQSTELVN